MGFVNVINIVDNYATFVFRIPVSYFIKVEYFLETGEYEEDEFGNPLPLNTTEELLSFLNEEVLLNDEIQNENILKLIQIFFDIWELIEYREKLDINSKIEEGWLNELENKYYSKITSKIDSFTKDYKDLIFSILDRKIEIKEADILRILNNIIKLSI